MLTSKVNMQHGDSITKHCSTSSAAKSHHKCKTALFISGVCGYRPLTHHRQLPFFVESDDFSSLHHYLSLL